MDLLPKQRPGGGSRRKGPGKVLKGPNDRNQFVGSIITTILIFMLVSGLYTWISERNAKTTDITLSVLAADISAGKVTGVVVEGNEVIATYTGETLPKKAKRETEVSFTETLKNYAVPAEAIQKLSIEIKDPSGFGFWFFNLAPIIIPILFIAVFIWFLTRQVRGAGMQAFSFGQSKARITLPDDKKQKVTFKDVAGAKEAKEELKEIVDFLKNPKKFIDIGAQIPKGVLLMGASGTGKCVSGETRLLTNKGLIPIDEVPKYFTVNKDGTVEGLTIAALDPKTLRFNAVFASHWYCLGEQATRKMRTDLGISIEGTLEHPIVAVDQESGNFLFRRLDELKEGDWIVVSYNTQFFGEYTKIPNEDVAYLMGALTGDGCLTVKNRICFSTADPEILSRVQAIARNHLSAEFSKTTSRPYDYELRDVRTKRQLVEWGLHETYAEGKRIPEWIRIAPKSFVTAFLKGLFDTDGYVEKYGAVGLSSASIKLIEDTYFSLLNLGIVARIYNRKKLYNNKQQFYLSVYGDFVETFAREIGFSVEHKKASLKILCERQRNTNINSIPCQNETIRLVWKEAILQTNKTLDRTFYAESLYKNAKRYMHADRYPSLRGMSVFLDGVSNLSPPISRMREVAYLRRLAEGQFFFTRVKALEDTKAPVYDLTVPHLHSFIANGIINHNTLLARAVAGEAGVPFFSISGSEFVEMFVGVGASVTGDTPVLIRTPEGIKLLPIGEFVDTHFSKNETRGLRYVKNVETLGVDWLRGTKFFKSSNWKKVESVYRHKVDTIYEIEFLGGKIKVTGDHSIFIRHRNHIIYKKASELQEGDMLVALPYNSRGKFIPGVGTTQHIRSHYFQNDFYPQELEVWSYRENDIAHRQNIIPGSIAKILGLSEGRSLSYQALATIDQSSNLAYKIKITLFLVKLMGYYAAEGDYHARTFRFSFDASEKSYHEECVQLTRNIFGLEPRLYFTKNNAVMIEYSSDPIGKFFVKHCGSGAHHKHVPEFIWNLPREYFISYLDGLVKGDGYINKKGLIEYSSASQQLIYELRWLLAMHGIASSVTKYVQEGGRFIGSSKKPLPDSTMWRITIGRLTNPFADLLTLKKFKTFSRKPVIKKITKRPYDGYVYDLCGCEGEAFFGGEKPILLHNSRVRDLFKMAKQAAPSIIFVDEIDAVGRVRGTGVGGGNDEREQTLNQILVEMDGFEPNEKVVIISATNRPDVLDPALVRPGRFDRRVVIDLPDRNDREEILKVHSTKKPFAEDVNLRVIAERTPGLSGADLYSLMNEGAILAARENRTKVSQFDLIRSIEKVMLGPERRSHLLSKKEKEITAYHEAGHALVASVLPYADPVHKISIISRGRVAGYTLKLPFEDRKLQSRKEFLDDIAVSLGGYVTELMIFEDLTTGPSNDLQVSTALARDMVTKYGMSEKMGPVALESAGGRVMFGRGLEDREYSEKVSAEIDAEVSKIISEAVKKAKDIIVKHRAALDAIATKLVEVETIEREEYEKLITAFGIIPKKKQDIEHQT